MSAQNTSGGTAAKQQFIDTVGGFTGIGGGGSDHQTISNFYPLQVTLNQPTVAITQFLSASLASLLVNTGYTPVNLFQSYRVKEFTLWIMDIAYGGEWNNEPQTWNVYLAPWRNANYQSTTALVAVKPEYIPGCVWKNMTAPSTGSKIGYHASSSADRQMLSITIHDPPFEMETYSKSSSVVTGTQMNNTIMPTYSSQGLDDTNWHAAIARFTRQVGFTDLPSQVFLEYMTKTVYEFTGLRCMFTSAFDDYLPNREDVSRKQVITICERNPNSKNMGNDTEDTGTNNNTAEIHSGKQSNNESPDRPPRKTRRWN